MNDVISYAEAFASPLGGDTAGIVSAVATARLNGTRRRIAASLAEAGQEQTAHDVLAFGAGSGNAWRPETGLALLADRNEAYGIAALQLAAACASTGGAGDLESQVNPAEWLYLDGWLTPVAGRCCLRSDGRSIAIHSDLGRTEYLLSSQNRCVPATASPGPWTACASGGLAPRYVTVSGLRHSVEGFPWISTGIIANPQVAAIDRPRADDSRISTIHQAWQTILDRASIFGVWIASTAQGCLLLDSNGSKVSQSGSSFDHPGLIALEPPDCPIFCGEILVHECAHQQLLVYSMVAPMVNADSQEMYYSPIKRANRSIDRVLTGAHAVGNMILYYAELSRTMKFDRPTQLRFDQHKQWFAEDYQPALDRSESLTEVGRALWNSLAEAVDVATK
jgi:HEXXH motif-containing protein